jgi:hypothetical protein
LPSTGRPGEYQAAFGETGETEVIARAQPNLHKRFYEKVVKAQADVAALLNYFIFPEREVGACLPGAGLWVA